MKVHSSGGETTLQCGDGQEKTFVGSVPMKFDQITTCRILVEDVRGAFQVSAGGSVHCGVNGERVVCQ